MVSSLSRVYDYPIAFVAASWARPFCVAGFAGSLSYFYASFFSRTGVARAAGVLAVVSFFFLVGFVATSSLLPGYTQIFSGIHDFVFIPSVAASVFMVAVALGVKIRFVPFTSPLTAAATGLLPFYAVVILSLAVQIFGIPAPRLQWLAGEYISKPAVFREVEKRDMVRRAGVLYSGPMRVTYSERYIELAEKVLQEAGTGKKGGSVIRDFGQFGGKFFFVTTLKGEPALIVYNRDGREIKRIYGVNRIYHSADAMALVESGNNVVTVIDRSLKEVLKIPYPPALSVKKAVFSHDLLALLYARTKPGPGLASTFSVIYRLDTGNRVGRINALDIAPRLKRKGFVSVDNTEKGLTITVLDRNSNRKNYVFRGGEFNRALIRQCGADRFFIRAQLIKDGRPRRNYMLLYDFYRYRRLMESSSREKGASFGSIIAVIGRYLLTDTNSIVTPGLEEVFSFSRIHPLPYRFIPSVEKTSVLAGEGAVVSADFTPLLDGMKKKRSKQLLIADIKGTLIVKRVIRFMDNIVVFTNNLIFIFDDTLQMVRRIDLPPVGYIGNIRVLGESVLMTFNREDSISIYSMGPDFEMTRLAVLNTRNGIIWDISPSFIVYGQEFGPMGKGQSGILIAKGLASDLLYRRSLDVMPSSFPALSGDRIVIPFKNFSEVVELRTGKRTVIPESVIKADDRPYGLTHSGFVINLLSLSPYPFRFDPERVGTTVTARGAWLDLHGYLLNTESGDVIELVREGRSVLGNGSLCSSTGEDGGRIVNCIDIDLLDITAVFPLDHDYDIIYSDKQRVLLKDNYALVAVPFDASH